MESEIESYLCEQAELHEFLCLKFVSPGNNGVPDRMLIGHGQTFFVETKAPGEKARCLQKCVIREMKQHGAEIYVLDQKDKIDNLFTEKRKQLHLSDDWFQKKKAEHTDRQNRKCRRSASVLLPYAANNS